MNEALAAALQLADALGIRTSAEQARVLSARGNLLVRLAPAPVVARVATFTAMSRRDPFAWLAREVSVAGYAARHGGPAVPPTDLADPGPHRVNGFAISLWNYAEPADTKVSIGQTLGELHLSLAGYPDEPVLADYSKVTGVPGPDQEQLMLFWKIRDLEATAWALCMAAQYPERYAPIARELLDKLR